MSEPLLPLTISRRTGAEPLHDNGQPLQFDLLAFWQWSASDLVSNVTRGRLAEFIVATAAGIDVNGVRNDWDAYDLTTSDGIKIEVKSAAYLQSWHQARLSDICFRTPRTRAWDAATNRQSGESRRQADVYVFAVLHHQEKSTIDPLNLAQWSFFVLPTRLLDHRTRGQDSITLKSLRALAGDACSYRALADAVRRAAATQNLRQADDSSR
jgi:hypothetical protein